MYAKIEDLTKDNFKEFILNNGWVKDSYGVFNLKFLAETIIHYDEDKIYAMSHLKFRDDYVYLHNLEVNRVYRGQGYGRKAMIEIANIILATDTKELLLVSVTPQSNAFYKKIGLHHSCKTLSKFTANEKELITLTNSLI